MAIRSMRSEFRFSVVRTPSGDPLTAVSQAETFPQSEREHTRMRPIIGTLEHAKREFL